MASGQGGRKETLVYPVSEVALSTSGHARPPVLGTPLCDPVGRSQGMGPGQPGAGTAPRATSRVLLRLHTARREDGAFGCERGQEAEGTQHSPGRPAPPRPPPPAARSYATICVNKSRTLSRDSTAGPGGSRKTRAPFTGRRLLTVAPGVPGHPQEPRKAALRTERWAPRAERGSVVSEAASVPARRPPGRAHGASAAFAADPRAARLRK